MILDLGYNFKWRKEYVANCLLGSTFTEQWKFRFKILSPKMGSIKREQTNKQKVDVFPLWKFCHSHPSCLSGRVKDSHVVSPWHFSGESHPLLLLWCSLTNANTALACLTPVNLCSVQGLFWQNSVWICYVDSENHPIHLVWVKLMAGDMLTAKLSWTAWSYTVASHCLNEHIIAIEKDASESHPYFGQREN